MATITVENVPNNIIKKYGNKVMFSYDLFSKESWSEVIILILNLSPIESTKLEIDLTGPPDRYPGK